MHHNNQQSNEKVIPIFHLYLKLPSSQWAKVRRQIHRQDEET